MSQTVIREVIKNVWTISTPFELGSMPLGHRSTAVKLSSGDVWVHASTPLDTETKEALDNLGPVKYLLNSSLAHHWYLAEFKKAYPEAKLIGTEGIVAKKKADGLKFDGEYGKDHADTKYGYEDEITTCLFSGTSNKEVAWFHSPSKTLIVGDLMFNLPATEQFSKTKLAGTLPSTSDLSHDGSFTKSTLWSFGVDKDQTRKDIKTVSEWDFERIILGHGNIIETDAKKVWENAYSKYR